TELADYQQPAIQRMGTDLPGRTNDGSTPGSINAPLPHLRDERRKFPFPRVDESQERQAGQVSEGSPPSVSVGPAVWAWLRVARPSLRDASLRSARPTRQRVFAHPTAEPRGLPQKPGVGPISTRKWGRFRRGLPPSTHRDRRTPLVCRRCG